MWGSGSDDLGDESSNELNHPIRQLPDGVQKMGMVFFSKPEPCRNDLTYSAAVFKKDSIPRTESITGSILLCRDVPEPCRNDLNYSAAISKKGTIPRTDPITGSFLLCRDVPEPCRNDLNYSAAVYKKGSISRTESMMGSILLCRDVPRSCRDGNPTEKEKRLLGY